MSDVRSLKRPPTIGAVGKVVVDQVLQCHHQPQPDGHQHVRRLLTAGGACANVVANVAAHGYPATLAGWCGQDSSSSEVTRDLEDLGVELRLVRRGKAPLATVLAWGGDRSFLVDQGDLRAIGADIQPDWFAGMDVVHLNGFDLLDYSWPDVMVEVAQMARAAGLAVSADTPTAARIEAQGAAAYLATLERVRPTVLFANAREARTLGLTAVPDWADIVVVHAGTDPTVVHTREGSVTFAVEQVVLDAETTGCGDAFAAGFLSAWAQSAPVSEAVARAHAWAAEIAEVVGAQPRRRL